MKSLITTLIAALLAAGCAAPQQTVKTFSETDKINGKTSQSRSLMSDNEEQTSASGLHAHLHMTEVTNALGFSVKRGVMRCSAGKITIRYRIDDTPEELLSAECAFGNSMFIVWDKATAARMINSKRLVVQVAFVSTVAQYTFNTASFAGARK